MDFSKAYDCIPDDLPIAKFEAYGLDKTSLHLLRDYLNNRKQRTKLDSSISDWSDIICGISQGSILVSISISNEIMFIYFKNTRLGTS